jgi:hypothetical protein
MNHENLLTQHEEDASPVPAWLLDRLQLAGDYATFTSELQPAVSAGFRARAREEAEIAFTLHRLRAESEKIGFVALSIGDYIQGIAKVANLSLPPVLNWLGIPDLRQPRPDSARGFARLGLEIGFSLAQILTHVRIALAGAAGSPMIPLLMARRRAGTPNRNDLQECLAVLEEVETQYDPAMLTDLRRIEAEIRAAYDGTTGQ